MAKATTASAILGGSFIKAFSPNTIIKAPTSWTAQPAGFEKRGLFCFLNGWPPSGQDSATGEMLLPHEGQLTSAMISPLLRCLDSTATEPAMQGRGDAPQFLSICHVLEFELA